MLCDKPGLITCINFPSLWKYLQKLIYRTKDLFWIMDSQVLVHGWFGFGPVSSVAFEALMRQKTMAGSIYWRIAYDFKVTRNQREKKKCMGAGFPVLFRIICLVTSVPPTMPHLLTFLTFPMVPLAKEQAFNRQPFGRHLS